MSLRYNWVSTLRVCRCFSVVYRCNLNMRNSRNSCHCTFVGNFFMLSVLFLSSTIDHSSSSAAAAAAAAVLFRRRGAEAQTSGHIAMDKHKVRPRPSDGLAAGDQAAERRPTCHVSQSVSQSVSLSVVFLRH